MPVHNLVNGFRLLRAYPRLNGMDQAQEGKDQTRMKIREGKSKIVQDCRGRMKRRPSRMGRISSFWLSGVGDQVFLLERSREKAGM